MARPTKSRKRCPLTTSKSLRQSANQQTAAIAEWFPPGMSQPALRALAAAGISRLEQLCQVTETELRAMHGMGPKGIRLLKKALHARGLSLAR